MNEKTSLCFQVGVDEEGLTLQQVLQRHSELSVKQIKQIIHEKGCLLRGRVERFSSTKVHPGDRVFIDLGMQREKSVAPSILFEDDDLLVLNKPAGMKSEEVDEGIVHRLDKETSGVIVIAKNSTSWDTVSRQFADRSVEKSYLALVEGKISKPQFEICYPYGKKKSFSGGSIWGRVSKERGKTAKTMFKTIRSNGRVTLLCCYPKTGRTHQIRAQLSELGHPIVCDALYGSRYPVKGLRRHFLHAESLSITHPKTYERLRFVAPLAKDLKRALKSENISR